MAQNRLSPDREAEIRFLVDGMDEYTGIKKFVMIEIFDEIDALRSELKVSKQREEWLEQGDFSAIVEGAQEWEDRAISSERERDALNIENAKLRAERDAIAKENQKGLELSQVILFSDKIKQERDAALIRIKNLRDALEKIEYWKSDARVCCFPVNCREVLDQDEKGGGT